MEKTEESKTEAKADGGGARYHGYLLALLALILVATAFNQYQILALYSMKLSAPAVSVAAAAPVTGSGTAQAGGTASLQPIDVRPSGVPAIYGAELGVKYDDISSSNPNVQATINKLAQFDTEGSPAYITLSGAELDRYVKVGSSIACEYCCGANTLVFANGQPACGCAHSYAMRGLLKYLIKNHGSEYTDEQLLEEAGKWKTLFFPGPLSKKAAVLKSQGIELNYVNLASNLYRGIENSATSAGASGSGGSSGASQVGGC